jgi:hypothetical protein
MQFNLIKLNTVVVRDVSHLPKSSIFSHEVLHLAGQSVDFIQKFSNFVSANFFFLSEYFNTLDLVFCIGIARVKLNIFIKSLNLVEQLFFVTSQLSNCLVHKLFFLGKTLVLSLQFCMFPYLVLQSSSDFLFNDVLHSLYIITCVCKSFFILITLLKL